MWRDVWSAIKDVVEDLGGLMIELLTTVVSPSLRLRDLRIRTGNAVYEDDFCPKRIGVSLNSSSGRVGELTLIPSHRVRNLLATSLTENENQHHYQNDQDEADSSKYTT